MLNGAGHAGHLDDGLRVVLAGRHGGVVGHRVVDEVLVEAAVLDGGGDGELALGVFGQAEPVADQLGAAGLNGVVIGEHAIVPDLVNAVQSSLDVDEAVGEGVGGGVEVAIGLDEAAFGNGFAGGILDGEVDPGLVEIALLGDDGVADAFVLDDDVGGEGFTGSDGEAGEAEGRDQDLIAAGGGGAFLFESKDIDIEDTFAVDAVAEKVDELGGLGGEVVVGGDEGIASEPAMRSEVAVLCAGIVGGFSIARHVAGLAGGDGVFAVERERRLLAEGGALPLVVDGEGAEPLVVVELGGDVGFMAGGAELGSFNSGRMTALEWRSRWARISASETGRVMGAPFSSTRTAGGPMT